MINKFKIICSKKNIKLITILLFGLIFAALVELAGIGAIPLFVMLILDVEKVKSKTPDFINLDFLNHLSVNEIAFFGAILLTIIFFVKNIFLGILIYFEGSVYKKMRMDLSSRLFKLYTSVSYAFHLKTNPSILLRNIEGETSQSISVIQSYLSLVREFLVLSVIFSLLVYVDPVISFIAFLFLSLFVFTFYLLTNKKLHSNGKIMQFMRAEITKHIIQSFGVIKEVKILGKESFLNKIDLKNRYIFEGAFFKNYFLSSLPRLFLEIIVISTIASITILFVFLERELIAMIPLLSLLVVAAVRLMPSFTTISGGLSRIKSLTPSINLVVDEILKLEMLKSKTIQNSIETIKFNKEIKFINLSFKYEGVENFAINNFNLSIKSGQKIGIIGTSGAGKSTFVDLMLGLLQPSSGHIEVDQTNINKNIRSWQNLIGYVPQDIYLLDDSIKNNIAFGVSEDLLNRKNLDLAIKFAQLESFISDLPNGIETMIGNRGVRISGGQRQRIGIARALYNDQKILIFDEATNSLDLENEKKIIEEIFLLDKSKTLILITHRHETVYDCDQIFLIKDGVLLDQGKYDYLNDKYNLNAFVQKNK